MYKVGKRTIRYGKHIRFWRKRKAILFKRNALLFKRNAHSVFAMFFVVTAI